jgi:hypothetical protein
VSRSPFATSRSYTYRYDGTDVMASRVDANGEQIPAPFAEVFEIDAETAAGVWLRLRLPTSRGDLTAIQKSQQPVDVVQNDGTLERRYNLDGKRDAFLQLAEAWQWDPESGESTPISADYGRLELWASSWIDACVDDAIVKGVTGYQKKESSPRVRKRSPSSST